MNTNSLELIFSANSVIDTDNGNVYPLVAETGDILYDEKKISWIYTGIMTTITSGFCH